MKKWFALFITSVLTLSLLVSCENNKKVNHTTETEKTEAEGAEQKEKKDINDFVTIKEEVNREDTTPNGDIVRYIYEVPVIKIDKPGAQKVNDMFLNLEKDMEKRIGDGQNLTIFIKSKAFLNDGMISVVMEIVKPGPGGIHAVNYDIKHDKEISTKELLEKHHFDPQKLIVEIDRQVKLNESKPEEEKEPIGVEMFAETIITNLYGGTNDYFNKLEDMQNKTKAEKERYVIENIDKLNAYMNEDGHFVFIHLGALPDAELIVE